MVSPRWQISLRQSACRLTGQVIWSNSGARWLCSESMAAPRRSSLARAHCDFAVGLQLSTDPRTRLYPPSQRVPDSLRGWKIGLLTALAVGLAFISCLKTHCRCTVFPCRCLRLCWFGLRLMDSSRRWSAPASESRQCCLLRRVGSELPMKRMPGHMELSGNAGFYQQIVGEFRAFGIALAAAANGQRVSPVIRLG